MSFLKQGDEKDEVSDDFVLSESGCLPCPCGDIIKLYPGARVAEKLTKEAKGRLF
jgi:hypothetical protein